MATRRGAALAGLVGSLSVLTGLPLAWSAAVPVPAESVGSREAVQHAPATAPSPAPAPALWPSVPTALPPPQAPVPPVEVDIEGIGVVAGIDPVGVAPDGQMVVPTDTQRVGWYEHGPAPGSTAGSAVLAGHVDSRTQGRGAMYTLGETQVGQPVRVRLADGTVVGYRIIARESISKTGLPVAELFARDGPPRLTLITCGGEFDRAGAGYLDNVVVTAVPDSSVEPDLALTPGTPSTPGIA